MGSLSDRFEYRNPRWDRMERFKLDQHRVVMSDFSDDSSTQATGAGAYDYKILVEHRTLFDGIFKEAAAAAVSLEAGTGSPISANGGKAYAVCARLALDGSVDYPVIEGAVVAATPTVRESLQDAAFADGLRGEMSGLVNGDFDRIQLLGVALVTRDSDTSVALTWEYGLAHQQHVKATQRPSGWDNSDLL